MIGAKYELTALIEYSHQNRKIKRRKLHLKTLLPPIKGLWVHNICLYLVIIQFHEIIHSVNSTT